MSSGVSERPPRMIRPEPPPVAPDKTFSGSSSSSSGSDGPQSAADYGLHGERASFGKSPPPPRIQASRGPGEPIDPSVRALTLLEGLQVTHGRHPIKAEKHLVTGGKQTAHVLTATLGPDQENRHAIPATEQIRTAAQLRDPRKALGVLYKLIAYGPDADSRAVRFGSANDLALILLDSITNDMLSDYCYVLGLAHQRGEKQLVAGMLSAFKNVARALLDIDAQKAASFPGDEDETYKTVMEMVQILANDDAEKTLFLKECPKIIQMLDNSSDTQPANLRETASRKDEGSESMRGLLKANFRLLDPGTKDNLARKKFTDEADWFARMTKPSYLEALDPVTVQETVRLGTFVPSDKPSYTI